MRPGIALCLCLSACGYTWGMGLHEDGIRTVAVRVVQSGRSSRPG